MKPQLMRFDVVSSLTDSNAGCRACRIQLRNHQLMEGQLARTAKEMKLLQEVYRNLISSGLNAHARGLYIYTLLRSSIFLISNLNIVVFHCSFLTLDRDHEVVKTVIIRTSLPHLAWNLMAIDNVSKQWPICVPDVTFFFKVKVMQSVESWSVTRIYSDGEDIRIATPVVALRPVNSYDYRERHAPGNLYAIPTSPHTNPEKLEV